jgi:hypothetical protein
MESWANIALRRSRPLIKLNPSQTAVDGAGMIISILSVGSEPYRADSNCWNFPTENRFSGRFGDGFGMELNLSRNGGFDRLGWHRCCPGNRMRPRLALTEIKAVRARRDRVRSMRLHRGSLETLALGSALVLSSCSTRERGASPAEHSQTASTTPALWEPIDGSFKGCAGG